MIASKDLFQEVVFVNQHSPFSRYYAVDSRPVVLREWDPLTPREWLLQEIISSCGAAAGFTLERLWPDPRKARKKLLALYRAGFLCLHKLRGEREMNVFSFSPTFSLEPGLRQLATAQFCVRLKEVRDCVLIPQTGCWTLSYRDKGREKDLRVLVFRKNSDDPLALLPLLKEPAVVVADALTNAFKGFPVRIALDRDLISGPLRFYLPDGTEDVESPFREAKLFQKNFR
ncbi:MAG: hypothetical protein AB1700_14055 [Bacillota bacterium]